MNRPRVTILGRLGAWWRRVRPAVYMYGEKNEADLEAWARRRAERELGFSLNQNQADEALNQDKGHEADIRQIRADQDNE
jgi:hypothetical protein